VDTYVFPPLVPLTLNVAIFISGSNVACTKNRRAGWFAQSLSRHKMGQFGNGTLRTLRT
jgi:hypothetical protein